MSPPAPSLARYRGLVEDWPAFCDALDRPLPVVVRANPRRIGAEALAARSAAAGFAPRPLAWRPGAFRIASGFTPGTTLDFAAGLYHLQEEVSLLPARLLGALPGERILDLCAAPGGKSAEIAEALAGRGTLVANDRDDGRLGPLRRALARLGAVEVATTVADGVNYPQGAGLFDRVLADVPCTCEGTSRKSPEALETVTASWREGLARVQGLLLAKALARVRPGGRVVYSTCTYAPEENEAVVDAALAAAGGAVRIVPARSVDPLPGLVASPGLTSWAGRAFHLSLEGALRVWPHQNDSGGFFVAVLEKAADASPGRAGRAADGRLRTVAPSAWSAPADRFGLPREAFEGLDLVAYGTRRLAAVAAGFRPTGAPPVATAGLPALHVTGRQPQLTTAGALAFGAAATCNVLEVDREGAAAYLAGDDPAGAAGALVDAAPGPLIVRWEGFALGLAQLDRAGRVTGLYPKGWRESRPALPARRREPPSGVRHRRTAGGEAPSAFPS